MSRATFLMSAYSAAPYLQECIDSVLNQSINDFEFWIIEDGSSDDSKEILEKQTDTRIIIKYNPMNLGIAGSLNQYLHKIETKYILRMDADDICLPDRLEKQLEFMELNPLIGLSGGALEYFGDNDYTWLPAEKNEAIEARLFFNCAIPNPTLIMRTSFIKEHQLFYNTSFAKPPMEDYALLIDSMGLCEMGNLKEVLVRHREHEINQSTLYAKEKEESMARIYALLFHKLEIPVNDRQLKLHYQLVYNIPDFSLYTIEDFINWSNYMVAAKKENTELKKTLRFYLFKLLKHLKPKPLSALQLMLYLYSI